MIESFHNDSLNAVEEHIQENLEDDVVQEVLKSDVDLRQYSQQIEKELKDVENASIQDYIKESQNIASLHNQIAACDGILEVLSLISLIANCVFFSIDFLISVVLIIQ